MILDQLPFAVLVIDENYNYVFSNSNFNQLFGTPEQIRPLKEIVPQVFIKEAELLNVLEFLKKDSAVERMVKIPRFRFHSDMEEDQYFTLLVLPLRVNGTIHFMIIFQDHTEEQAEEISSFQHAKLVALGEMAAGIAHEINNFLSILQGHVDLAEMKNSDKTVAEHLQFIRKQIDSIAAFSKSILNFSRQNPREFVDVSLNHVVEETLRFLQARMRKNNVKIVLKLEKNPSVIRGNPSQLQQLLINLLLNSKKAIRQKGEIVISTRTVSDSAVLEISDNGIGMSREIAARIFNPFFTTRKEGNGLGLNICEKIVKNHGGFINFTTREHYGTTFTVTFPRRK